MPLPAAPAVVTNPAALSPAALATPAALSLPFDYRDAAADYAAAAYEPVGM